MYLSDRLQKVSEHIIRVTNAVSEHIIRITNTEAKMRLFLKKAIKTVSPSILEEILKPLPVLLVRAAVENVDIACTTKMEESILFQETQLSAIEMLQILMRKIFSRQINDPSLQFDINELEKVILNLRECSEVRDVKRAKKESPVEDDSPLLLRLYLIMHVAKTFFFIIQPLIMKILLMW